MLEQEVFIIPKIKSFIIPVLSLILMDQIVKLVISSAFIQYDFDIIRDMIRFKPQLNIKLSYAGNYIPVLSNLFITVFLNMLAIFIFITGYMLYKTKRKQTSITVKIIMVCGIAGCLCSLIDKLFWGGSLDFLQIPNFFIFDLKDCYLTVAEVLFVVIGIIHSKEISVKEYINFCFHKLL